MIIKYISKLTNHFIIIIHIFSFSSQVVFVCFAYSFIYKVVLGIYELNAFIAIFSRIRIGFLLFHFDYNFFLISKIQNISRQFHREIVQKSPQKPIQVIVFVVQRIPKRFTSYRYLQKASKVVFFLVVLISSEKRGVSIRINIVN